MTGTEWICLKIYILAYDYKIFSMSYFHSNLEMAHLYIWQYIYTVFFVKRNFKHRNNKNFVKMWTGIKIA